MSLYLTLLAFCLIFALAVRATRHQPRIISSDLAALRTEIERRERKHMPRRHLRRQMVLALAEQLKLETEAEKRKAS